MPKISAGIVLYKKVENHLEFLLVHPGGPLFAKKDLGVWSIPKGEVKNGEDYFIGAKREFAEEIGFTPEGEFISLGSVTQKSGKVVHAWGIEGDFDISKLQSNNFKMEWPPRSGKFGEFPEVDRAEFFNLDEAKLKVNPAQIEFLEKLEKMA